ncbi:MAG TPA: TRAP transporter TatT component family protein [Pyrinomonadaceae bacterium]|nr:TRAP transporter TatT component family protein [Pyrinomonadaceae bacterium]
MKLLLPLSHKTLPLTLAALVGLTASCAREQAMQASTADPVAVAKLLSEADEHYANRTSIEHARQAVAILRRARMTDYNSYEAVWKLARCQYYVGSHEEDEKLKLAAFREGIAAGESAVKLAPDKPEGHFWLGANLGGRAKVQGPLYALSSVPDIRREMETVIRLDEGFQAGSAYLALGQLDLELPEMFGGDRKRAVEVLEKGLRFGQNNSLLRLRLAEAYYAVKRRADARAQANAILVMKHGQDYLPEHEEASEGARRILKKLE